jgi:sarcosine oxidase gamma subunit
VKHGKNPTKAQKIRIKALGLNPDEWLVVKDCKDCFQLVHRVSRKIESWDYREEINL